MATTTQAKHSKIKAVNYSDIWKGNGLQILQKTNKCLDRYVVRLIEFLGKSSGDLINAQDGGFGTFEVRHLQQVFSKTSLPKELFYYGVTIVENWISETLKGYKQKLSTKGAMRNSKKQSSRAGLAVPVYTEPKLGKEVKKPGVETFFRDKVWEVVGQPKRIHRDVYILVAALVEKIMDSVITSAAEITRKLERKQITEGHLAQGLENNEYWEFLQQVVV